MNALANLLARQKAKTESPAPAVPAEGVPAPAAAKVEESSASVPTPSTASESSPALPTLRPAAPRLLATPKPAPKASSIIDSNKVAAVLRPELTVEAIAEGDGSIPDPNAGERFKMMLDVFDSKLQEIGGNLDRFNIDLVRGMVSRIMIDLKEHPDYDGLYLGDRDVHNIMAFMYNVREIAQEMNQKKETKAVTKAPAKSMKKSQFAAALEDMAIQDLKL